MPLKILSLLPYNGLRRIVNNNINNNNNRNSNSLIKIGLEYKKYSNIKLNSQFIEKNREFKLTDDEEELFELFLNIVNELKLGSTIRIAGGWVRDKLLGVKGKPDIDVALDNMTGRDFINSLNIYYKNKGQKTVPMGIIQQNPEKSKHLETATAQLGRFSVDFVNLRTETYTENSRIPVMEIGTPMEDASRRDLTINALFYNVNTNSVEDYTGIGLKDLEDKIVRTPLPALRTLEDDPLRAFRAIRFACRFNFKMEDELFKSCTDPIVHNSLKTKVSYERINTEFDAMMIHPLASRAVVLLYDTGLIKLVFPLPPIEQVLLTDSNNSKNPSPEILKDYHSQGIALNLFAEILKEYDFFNKVIETSGEDIKIFRIASLNKVASSYYSKHPTKGNRILNLNERILLLGLKMKGKDVTRIMKLQEASKEFVKILNNIIIINNNDKITKITNISYGILSRVEVGLAIREAGSNYQYAILLACTEVLLDILMRETNNNNINDIIKKLIKILGITNTSSSSSSSSSSSKLEISNVGIDIGLESNKYESFISAIEYLFKAIEVLQLKSSYDISPLVSGAEIKKMLPELPLNETFGLIMQSQIKWILEHPNDDNVGQEKELREYILNTYNMYR